jgi:tetratricopeptide (TPR) repeat protein
MSNNVEVDTLKQEAAALMQQKDFKGAALVYSKALKLEPTNAIVYSNRSAAFFGMERYNRALQDADQCISLQPAFLKGYYRRLRALELTGADDDEIRKTILKALALDPSSADFLQALRKYAPSDARATVTVGPDRAAIAAKGEPATATQTSEATSQASDPRLMHMMPVVLEFASATVADVCTTFDNTDDNVDAKMRAAAYLLPSTDAPLPVISIERAFLDTKLSMECAQFLRETAKRDACIAAVIIVQVQACVRLRVARRIKRRDRNQQLKCHECG